MIINHENSIFEKQSITSFKSSSSIRRTFSAEMLRDQDQSIEWLDLSGDEYDQIEKKKKNSGFESDEKKGAFEDIWSTIQKNVGSGSGSSGTDLDILPPPYVHPLVKRSTSLLSQKSLEVCTESLGSETGLDQVQPTNVVVGTDADVEVVPTGWETGLDRVQPNTVVVGTDADVEVVPTGCTKVPSSRRFMSPPSTFPPPLPSREGSNLHMRAHRLDGRLVMEAVAVAVSSVKSLSAHRHDGRLLLTLTQNDEEKEKGNGEKELAIVMESKKTPFSSPSNLIMSKLTELTNCRWPRNMNATIVKIVEDSDSEAMLNFKFNNAYEYYWKKLAPLVGSQPNNKVGPQVEGKVVVLKAPPRGGGRRYNNNNNNNNNNNSGELIKEAEHLIPIMRGCKRRSSLLFWDSDNFPSFCIATS